MRLTLRMPTVYQAAHTQILSASVLFGKTCPSCLLGAQPAGEMCASWGTAPYLCSSPGSSNTESRLVSSIVWRLSQVYLGRKESPRSSRASFWADPSARHSQNMVGSLHRADSAWEQILLVSAWQNRWSEDKGNLRSRFREDSALPSGPGARKGDGEGDSEPNSPKGVSGGEVRRDGQVTPHLLPTPDEQAQLQTVWECLRLAADGHHDRPGAPAPLAAGRLAAQRSPLPLEQLKRHEDFGPLAS